MLSRLASLLTLLALAGTAAAAPPEPRRGHPRLFLDAPARSALEAAASRPGSAVARAITRCERIHDNPGEFADGGFQGLYFAEHFGACAIAYVATGDSTHGA